MSADESGAAEETKAATPSDWKVETVEDLLRQVVDPELHFNILDLGLIYGVSFDSTEVNIDMTLTSPACPYGPMIIHDVKEMVATMGATEVNINLVWDPPWGPDRMTDEAKLDLGFDL